MGAEGAGAERKKKKDGDAAEGGGESKDEQMDASEKGVEVQAAPAPPSVAAETPAAAYCASVSPIGGVSGVASASNDGASTPIDGPGAATPVASGGGGGSAGDVTPGAEGGIAVGANPSPKVKIVANDAESPTDRTMCRIILSWLSTFVWSYVNQ